MCGREDEIACGCEDERVCGCDVRTEGRISWCEDRRLHWGERHIGVWV